MFHLNGPSAAPIKIDILKQSKQSKQSKARQRKAKQGKGRQSKAKQPKQGKASKTSVPQGYFWTKNKSGIEAKKTPENLKILPEYLEKYQL